MPLSASFLLLNILTFDASLPGLPILFNVTYESGPANLSFYSVTCTISSGMAVSPVFLFSSFHFILGNEGLLEDNACEIKVPAELKPTEVLVLKFAVRSLWLPKVGSGFGKKVALKDTSTWCPEKKSTAPLCSV